MKIEIKVDISTCIKCGKCSKVCPVSIFTQPTTTAKVGVQNIESCFKCGHCVSVCPSGSITHSLFPPQIVHPIDSATRPSPEQLMQLIKSRRSTRNFTKKPIPEHTLNLIVEAANCAPTAGNSQEISYTLVTDPDKLYRISELTVKALWAKVKSANNPILRPIVRKFNPTAYQYVGILGAVKANFESGGDPILRGATAILFIHAPKDSMYGREDANLAYQNGSLMAESLGVGQVYTGFVNMVIKNSGVREMLGIEGEVHAGMALGMPSIKYANYIDREIKLKNID